MSKFEYSLDIGDYNDDTRISISIKIKDGLTPEDYKIVRDALEVIETTARSYEESPPKESND